MADNFTSEEQVAYDTLVALANECSAKVSIFADNNCVNVITAQRAFCCTAYYDTFLHNVQECTNFLSMQVYTKGFDIYNWVDIYNEEIL